MFPFIVFSIALLTTLAGIMYVIIQRYRTPSVKMRMTNFPCDKGIEPSKDSFFNYFDDLSGEEIDD